MIKILIAEDDRILALYFKSLLIDMGFETKSIAIADSGKKTVKLTQKLKPDIIFMDITMELEIDGIDACQVIKEADTTVKIVFVSAYPENFFKDKLKNIIYDGYIEKPFKIESIKRSLIACKLYNPG